MSTREQAEGGKTSGEDDGGGAKRITPCDLFSEGSVPKLLKKSAGGEKCCIFRIPQRLEKNNENAYEPRVVSVGPYHNGKAHLHMIQEHKHRLLGFFMAQVEGKGVDPKDLIEAVSQLEERIRESYSETLYHGDVSGGKKLIDMMILDGCFILMLFMVVAGEVQYSGIEDDPLFRVPWILPAIRNDLLLLENQVPFFLLQTIFERSKIVTSTGLNEITFSFFNYSIHKPDIFWSNNRHELEANHLLDLIRMVFMPTVPGKEEKEEEEEASPFLRLILSAKKLQLRGIKFRPRKNAETLLDIKLEKNVVEIPQIILDDFIISFLLNCVAFEQFYADSKNHITSYVAFMGCLLRNEDDAMFLDEKGIIENYFGSGVEVSQIFKVIGKDIIFHLSDSYLAEVFEGINKYTSRGLHVQWAGFKHTHFDTPWTCLSSSAALILLLLTIFQAFFAGYAYFRPPKDN